MGPPLPWSCVSSPPPSTRHHVQVQSRFTTYQVVIIITNCISNESRSLSTFVHYRGDLMQCGVGKPFNIPSAKLGIHHHHNIDIIVTIITTRPKPAYGRQGLAGSWGQDTDEVSTFLVFLTSHFAPAALSSDLTNLGPLMTLKIPPETTKRH